MFSILTDLEGDASQQARNALLHVGLKRTLESPILGDYGGVIHEFGNLGSYIHNILSYWQTYGLLPFILAVLFFILQPYI